LLLVQNTGVIFNFAYFFLPFSDKVSFSFVFLLLLLALIVLFRQCLTAFQDKKWGVIQTFFFRFLAAFPCWVDPVSCGPPKLLSLLSPFLFLFLSGKRGGNNVLKLGFRWIFTPFFSFFHGPLFFPILSPCFSKFSWARLVCLY